MSNEINSLEELITRYKELLEEDFCKPNIRLYFRGERTDYEDTKCLPSIFRKKIESKDENLENETYYRFLRRHPEDFANMSNLDILTKMQHYGIPTRLLDITTNPLVALFFACHSFDKEDKKNGYIYVFKAEKEKVLSYDSDKALLLATLPKIKDEHLKIIREYIKNNPNKEITPEIIDLKYKHNGRKKIDVITKKALGKFIYECERERTAFHKNHRVNPEHLTQFYYVKPQFYNTRMKLQHSLFILFGLSKGTSETDTEYFKNLINKSNLITFVIPQEAKKKILSELKFIAGISYSSLFGDLSATVQENKDQLYNDFKQVLKDSKTTKNSQ